MAKYANPPQAPPLFIASKESILADAKAMCDRTRALLDRLVADIQPGPDATFDNVLGPQLEEENAGSLSTRILGFYQYVSGDSGLRDASTEAEKMMDEFGIECSMRDDVFALVDSVYQRSGLGTSKDKDKGRLIDEKLAREAGLPDVESANLLERERKGYITNGLSLPAGPRRDRFKAIKKRLSELSISFSKNLNEENGAIWLTREELDGVPADVLDGLDKGSSGGEHEGKLRLSFKYPDLFPALKYDKHEAVRKRIFMENENKVNENVPIFREAILLRDEAARLLGYPDHATLRIEDKMAKTPQAVLDFLGDLKTKLAPGGKREVARLLELKKKDVTARQLEFDGKYYLWDHRFYDRMLVEQEYSIDEQAIAAHFPLKSTVAGMLGIFEELFGLVFVELTPEDRRRISPTGKAEDMAWHEDVIIFSVWDDEAAGDGFVGYLYLDLHPRPGKYGHAANFNLQPGFLEADGKTRRHPATALVCNFSKPTAKKPSLLKHDEVVTLFHELGHGIHDLTGRTRYARFHGTSTVRDFVEAPSQMLENWCWTPSVLRRLSSHWETGEKMADDMMANLVAIKHVNDALFNLRQLHFGLFDMTVHTPKTHDELAAMDIPKTYNELRAEISGIQGPEATGSNSNWGNGQATFGHLMGGYDAGYYGYLSSQVFSTDMFYSVFKANPMDGKQGRRYRHTVLERGGSQDEMLTLEQFLGRKPSTDAFYKELGLET